MKAGPMTHAVAFELPEGVDADLNLFFTSDSMTLNARITISGTTTFADADGIRAEAARIMASPDFGIANDWRLMTRPEVIAYRKEEKSENQVGPDHH